MNGSSVIIEAKREKGDEKLKFDNFRTEIISVPLKINFEGGMLKVDLNFLLKFNRTHR